jgi:hypothetical protein
MSIRLDALLGCPDRNMGSDFSKLESAHNLPKTLEIAFLKLVTLAICHNEAIFVLETKTLITVKILKYTASL